MIVGIQGSPKFKDYTIFLRAMGTALYSLSDDDKEFTVISCGPQRINEMAMEFINVSNLKSRGIKSKVVRMPPKALQERLQDIDCFIYLCLPKEPRSFLVKEADDKDVDVQVYCFA